MPDVMEINKEIVMCKICLSLVALAALPAVSAPEISSVAMTVDSSGMVTITYKLTGEDAIVTPDVLTNGIPIGAANVRGFVGDVNREMEPGDHTIYWCPRTFWPNRLIEDGKLQVKLTAWSKANPPDYMAQSIQQENLRFFYASAEEVPHDVTNRAYKTNLLLMRRIHATGTSWTAGLSENDPLFEDSNAHLAHVVTLTNDYYIGVFETTVAQFKMVSCEIDGSNDGLFNSQFTNEVLFAYPDTFVRPIDSASWCRLRMNTTSSNADYCWPQKGHAVKSNSPTGCFRKATGLDLDLPTEAQWEFAARAGSSESAPADIDAVAWTSANWKGDPMRKAYGNKNGSHEVGLLAANAFGLYDMLGNNAEWCLDAFPSKNSDPYQGAETLEPVGPAGENADVARSLRGGAYDDSVSTADEIGPCWRMSRAYTGYSRYEGFRYVCPAVLP